MTKIKTVAVWVAIIWGANWMGSHGYRVGDGIKLVTGFAAKAAHTIESTGKDK